MLAKNELHDVQHSTFKHHDDHIHEYYSCFVKFQQNIKLQKSM